MSSSYRPPGEVTQEARLLALEAAVAGLAGGGAALFIQASEPVVTGAALWVQPGGGFAIQEA